MIKGVKYDRVQLAPSASGLFTLAEDCIVEISTDTGTIVIDIEAGFLTDMGSVPRWVRGWIDYIGSQDQAVCYLVHDALYGTQEHQWSKEWADELLYEMMGYLGCQSRLKRWLIYTAVDIGGWSAWDSYPKINKGKVRASHGL